MESHGDHDGFKHIPVKIYSDDGICNQHLVSPKNNDGSRKILQQMIAELYPNKTNGMLLHSYGILLVTLVKNIIYEDNSNIKKNCSLLLMIVI